MACGLWSTMNRSTASSTRIPAMVANHSHTGTFTILLRTDATGSSPEVSPAAHATGGTGSPPSDRVRTVVTMPPRRDTPLHDCADPEVMTAFWGAALGYVPEDPPPGYASWAEFASRNEIPRSDWRGAVVDPSGQGPRLFFPTVPEPKTGKNRVHLDIGATAGPGQPLEE